MRNMRINYVAVGVFVLVMVAALIGVVVLLAGRTGGTDTYIARFFNVNGVRTGSKVTYEGYVVGQVAEIAPLSTEGRTQFQLKLEVKEGWPIPKDSVVRITSSGLLSAVVVDIKGGTSQEVLKPGSEIAAGANANLFAAMSDMASQVSDLNQTALKPLIATLNLQLERMGGILEKQAPDLLANLVAISGDLAQKTPKITTQLSQMSDTLSGKVVTDANAEKLAKTMDNMAQLTEGLEQSRRKLDATLASLDKVVGGNRETVDASLKDLRYTLQTVARSIDSMTYNLEGTTRNFNEFSRQLRDDPSILLSGRRPQEGPAKK